MTRNLVYEKSSGTRQLEAKRPIDKSYSATDKERVLASMEDVPSAYRKDDGMLSYSLICVISGGTVRERVFLYELEKKHSFRSVDVIFVSTSRDAGGLTPTMMQTLYDEIYENGVIDISGRKVTLESVDRIYMFTDVDHYADELKEILKTRESISPIWIISNPDFEIWLYYCFRNSPDRDLLDVVNEIPSQRSSRLKTVNGTFNNGGGLDPRKAFDHLEDGIAHSKEHYQESDGIPDLLSTQMHIFAEDIIMRLGEEYRAFVQKKHEFIASMRNRSSK